MDGDVTFAQQRDSVLKVHLRMRYSKNVAEDDEVYEIAEEDPNTLIANAPEDSATFKNANRNHTSGTQKFKFSNIFGPSTSQIDFFQLVATPMLEECLNMESNCLLFSYGVTNSGKTYTMQGPAKDAGIIPRSLDLIFNTLGNKIKPKSMYYPALFNDVHKMTDKLQQQKESVKQRILYPPNLSQTTCNITGVSDAHNTTRATQGSLLSEFDEASYHITDNDTRIVISDNEDIEYSVWISFVELYNESLFDLLEPPSQDVNLKKKETRQALRLGDDHSMSVYVKGATQLEVTNTAEAYRAMAYGNRNKKMAATAMNQTSSRSHSIFKVTVIATNNTTQQSRSTQMSFVDLAGSERYGKTNALGARLKEAGNINTSLLTLGKCINSLRHNQNLKPGQQGHIVPFRESKLTRLFKTFLSGEGMLAMVVCVNPTPACYDETLHALKFSALASEVSYQFKAPVTPLSHDESRVYTKDDLEELEWEIRDAVTRKCQRDIKYLNERHILALENVKGIEMRYHDGIMENYEKYYEGQMNELKTKVRAARAQVANCNCSQEKEKRRSESQNMVQQLQKKTSELAALGNTKELQETQLSQVKLELRTTRSLYKESLDEKERENKHFTKLLAEKDEEVKMYFTGNEELTKSVTFFEKELNNMKELLASNVEQHDMKLRERDAQINQLTKELADMDQLEKKLTLDNQELKKESTSNADSTALKQALEQAQHLLEQSRGRCAELENTVKERDLKCAELQRNLEEERAALQSRCKKAEENQVQMLKKVEELEKGTEDMYKEKLEAARRLEEFMEKNKELEEKLGDKVTQKSFDELQKSTKELKKDAADVCKKKLEAERKLEEVEKKCAELTDNNKELEEELSDLVRNKSLQFDAIITDKEREVDTLCEKTQQYESEMAALKRRISELEELAVVQKQHLDTIQSEKENLAVEVNQQAENLKKGENRATILEELHLKNKQLREEQGELKRENDRLTALKSAASSHEGALEKHRLEAEIARQELDRVKIQLSAARRDDQSKKLQLQLEAKDIELENWYKEKEKAVNMISAKKEKEIALLQTKLEQLEQQGGPVNQTYSGDEELSAALETAHQQLADLKADSMKKLEELADIVVQRENEKDYVQNQFEDYKSQVNELVSEKEAVFASLKKQLEGTKKENEELKTVNRALQEDQDQQSNSQSYPDEDKENTYEEMSNEFADQSVLDQSPYPNLPLRRVQTMRSDGMRRSKRIASMSESYCEDGLDRKKARASSRSGRKAPRKSLGTGNRRTSQVMISSKNSQLKSARSRTSRIATRISEATEETDHFQTPEPVGLKRKATFKKGLKNLMSSGSKKGKQEVEMLSESGDSASEFITPAKTSSKQPTEGKRKLCKTQISSPLELLPVPAVMKVQDIEETKTRSSTRSRAKLIKQHLSGTANTRKTRSRVAKNSSET